MTLSFITYYIIVLLLTLGVTNTWFNSTIKIHLTRLIIQDKASYDAEVFTLDDYDEYLLMRYGKIGELLTCKICLSHWISLAITILVMFATGFYSIFLPIFCFFTVSFFVSKFV